MLILALIVLSAQAGLFISPAREARAADNGLGQKPYMGWSSYSMQVYSGNGQWITAEQIKAQSDAMHDILQPYGYTYINVDAGWNGGMDEYGRPVPSATLYPDGLQDVIDHVHKNGQKFGLYLIPGLSKQAYEDDLPIFGTSCTMQDIAAQPLKQGDFWGFTYKIDFSNPCAQSYIDSIADLLHEWGVDFVKFDSVTPGSGIYDLSMDARDDVKAWSQALSRHGIWLELSWAVDIRYADYWKQYANGWRIDWDIECYCGTNKALTKWENIARLFPKAAQWWRHAGPGGWNDFDSLNIGNGSMDGLTRDERRTAMTFWAVSAAPLYIGNDMTKLDSFGIELLTNKEVIAVNQAGRPARPVSIETDQQVWYAVNEDGSYHVALFNLGNTEAAVHVKWSDIGLTGPAAVRDLWSHKDLGIFETGFSAPELAPHASMLLKVVPTRGTVAVNDDDTAIRYAGGWKRNGGKEMAEASQPFSVTITDAAETERNSAIHPSAASFDKGPDAQADVTVTMELNGNEWSGIVNGDTALEAGVDYSVSGSQVTIKKEYLAKQPAGTAYLTFGFSAGAAQALAVSISENAANTEFSVNDDDPGIVYSGSWQRSWNRGFGDYMDDVHYTETNGDYFEYAFVGTGIDLITETDSSQGEIDVYLDGQFMATIDTHSASRSVQQAVYGIRDLDFGPHTFKAVKKSGIFMLLDKLRVLTGQWISPVKAEFDKNPAAQADVTIDLAVDGSALLGIANGSEPLVKDTDYTVSGKKVTIHKSYLASLPVGLVHLTFRFDSSAEQSLSVFITDSAAQNSGIRPATASYDKKATDAGDITVAITPNGNTLIGIMNGSTSLVPGTDYTVSGDIVTIKKTYWAARPTGNTYLTFVFSAGAPQVLTVAVTEQSAGRSITINNDDPSISYSGSWNHNGGRGMGDYMDDVQFTERNGDYFEYTFVGTGIEFVTELHSSQGDVDIYVDDEYKTTVSTYLKPEDGRLAQQTVYSIYGLPNGTHTLKAVKKSGSFMLLDKLVIFLENLISPHSATFNKKPAEQTDLAIAVTRDPSNLLRIENGGTALTPGADYTISGNTVTLRKEYLAQLPVGVTDLVFTFRGDYLHDVHYTETDGDAFEYTFQGTGIEWVTAKGPDQGEVDVYVDGTFRETVNTYHDNRLTGQTVFSISGLENGTHTFKAVKKSGAVMRTDMLRFTVANAAGSPPSSPPSTGPVPPSASVPAPPSERIPAHIEDATSGTAVFDLELIRTTQPDGRKTDEVNLTEEAVRAAIGKLAATGGRHIRIAIPDAKDEVSEINVKVPKAAIQLLAEANIELSISTEHAIAVIPPDSLQGYDDDVTIRIEPMKDDAEKQAVQERANETDIVKLAAGGKNVTVIGRPVQIDTSLQHRKVTLTLPWDEASLSRGEWKNIGVYVEHSDGSRELLRGVIVPSDGQGRAGMQFTVDKFSTFALVHVPGWAETGNGKAYINGYADGLFRPDSPVTRAEMAAILSRVMERGDIMEDMVYNDVQPGYWAKEAISKVTKMGLMNGYADGSFRGDQPITRAEMAELVARVTGNVAETGAGFADIAGHWAQSSILRAQAAGILNGYPDGTFRPDRPVTRAEAVTIVNRLIGRSPSVDVAKPTWKDVPDNHWAFFDIEAASADE
jgi:hypothetical protein